MDAKPSDAMRGVVAVVATGRLMATVWHDRGVMVDAYPECAAERGDPGLRCATPLA